MKYAPPAEQNTEHFARLFAEDLLVAREHGHGQPLSPVWRNYTLGAMALTEETAQLTGERLTGPHYTETFNRIVAEEAAERYGTSPNDQRLPVPEFDFARMDLREWGRLHRLVYAHLFFIGPPVPLRLGRDYLSALAVGSIFAAELGEKRPPPHRWGRKPVPEVPPQNVIALPAHRARQGSRIPADYVPSNKLVQLPTSRR